MDMDIYPDTFWPRRHVPLQIRTSYPGTGWTNWQPTPTQRLQISCSVETRCFSPDTIMNGMNVSQKSSFSTRWTWRDYEQCLRIEDDPWRLSWVFPTLRRLQQRAKVDSSLRHSFNLAIQVLKRLWRRCWTLSCPGLRKVLPPSGVLWLISVAGRKAWISFQRGANIQQQPTSPSLAEAI